MTAATPWAIRFFCRHKGNDAATSVPASDFLAAVPPQVQEEMLAVLDAVAEAPPPSYSGGGKWAAMHGGMAGFYEVRVAFGGFNYRLFCRLERPAADLGGPCIVCIGGLRKPKRSAATQKDYRQIKRFGAEFVARRTVVR